MERVYFSIDETKAKTAHEMMSFSDYKPGSKTAEYQFYVDKAYAIADLVAKERPDEAERVYRMAENYAKKLASNMNDGSRIGCMCPSVMISGPSNFPVRKKERQNVAWDKNYKEFIALQGILKKIEKIRFGREVISSGDKDAVEKLEKKLGELRATQEKMKAANKAIGLKDSQKGDQALKNLGFSEEQIQELRTPDFCGRIGFPAYSLQNNNANIRRVEDRLKTLKAYKEKGVEELECKFFKIIENTEKMRLQLIFDGKPEPEVREVLKKNGFKWAPSQGAWQRQATRNARYALKEVIKRLEEMESALSAS